MHIMFILQRKGEAKSSRVMLVDRFSKIERAHVVSFHFISWKIFQLDWIIYQKYFIFEFLFFFLEEHVIFSATENVVNIIFKGKLF